MTARQTETDEAVPRKPFSLYDGECPFCSFYAEKTRFETRIGRPLRLVDARKAPGLVGGLERQGLDVDSGMILVLDGRRYHGSVALAKLGAITAGSRRLDRLARWFAPSPARARLAYPWLSLLRRAALIAKDTPRLADDHALGLSPSAEPAETPVIRVPARLAHLRQLPEK